MNKPPAFQFYPGDFLSDPNTLIMSAEEIGVYWLLICACWKDDGLSSEIKKLSRLARVQEKKFIRLWKDSISNCFYFDEESKQYRHRRLDEELEKQSLNSAKRQKAANARWMQMHSKCIPDAIQVECSSSSSSTSSSTSGEEIYISPTEAPAANAPADLHSGTDPELEPSKEDHPQEVPDSPPLTKATSKATKAARVSESIAPAVREIFAYWQAILSHQTAKLTDPRRRKIEARLREGYTVEQIKRAIDGCKASPFHQGMGPQSDGTVYDDIELICRDGSKVEMFEAKLQRPTGNASRRSTTSTLAEKLDEASKGAYKILFGDDRNPQPFVDAEVIS